MILGVKETLYPSYEGECKIQEFYVSSVNALVAGMLAVAMSMNSDYNLMFTDNNIVHTLIVSLLFLGLSQTIKGLSYILVILRFNIDVAVTVCSSIYGFLMASLAMSLITNVPSDKDMYIYFMYLAIIGFSTMARLRKESKRM